ncbi:uncharacterized protein DUF3313 [Luteibacter rhizovicinus]|uniref:Uncharacterized protein DUF3313 n=1 Tax=Luteibacter rhizovicinus TaxID=242606 RepID=A0A4R3YVE4_9GAMM|nr:DUF3313 domain-containing protein [Luteibacter rhizovicinus]TCV96416.1 uncharacterized protein DUF3313 [Luteibacter rhizovicinus]
MNRTIMYTVALAATSLWLGGCAATRPIPYSELASSTRLQPSSNPSGRIPYEYTSATDWSRYGSAVVDSVAIYHGQDNQFENMSEDDKRVLAEYMRAQFSEALQSKFGTTHRAGPGSLRIELTLTGAKPTKQFLGTFTKFDLGGGPYNVVQSIRGKEGLMGGSVSYAVEIYDSTTNRLLAAYVAKQYPNAMNVKSSIGALTASKTGIRKGAEDLVARLD